MSLDISHILDGWPYEPNQVSARRIIGLDGRERIQLRLELGLLQMETTGRPDGGKPHGFESLLDYHEHRLQRHKDDKATAAGFELDEEACELLRTEGMMYYHRYLAEFILEDYESVERDASRNLRLMDLCKVYAKEESDRYALQQYRPYVVMMCTRARGRLALRNNRPKEALKAVQAGIQRIKDFYREYGQEEMLEASGEIALLKAMPKEIELRIPVDPLKRLREKLEKAIRDERYEEAAHLRDQLRRATRRMKGGIAEQTQHREPQGNE